MNLLQWIRSILFSAQATIAMPIIGLAFAPWALFSKRGAYTACRTYAAYTIWSARWIVGMRCEVRGTPPEGAVLVASKHQSFLDIIMIYNALPLPKFIYKKQLRYAPVIGQYLIKMQMIAVDRGKRGQAITRMLQDVEAGQMEPGQLVIYPQGTRVRPGAQRAYKSGTGILYKQLDQPCVPVATNAGVFWPRRGLYRRPGVAVVEFLDPIPPGKDRVVFMAELEKVVEEASERLLEETGVGSLFREQ